MKIYTFNRKLIIDFNNDILLLLNSDTAVEWSDWMEAISVEDIQIKNLECRGFYIHNPTFINKVKHWWALNKILIKRIFRK
jgi:hypothetical protein